MLTQFPSYFIKFEILCNIVKNDEKILVKLRVRSLPLMLIRLLDTPVIRGDFRECGMYFFGKSENFDKLMNFYFLRSQTRKLRCQVLKFWNIIKN